MVLMLGIAILLSSVFLIFGGEIMHLYDSDIDNDFDSKHVLIALLIGYPFSAMISIMMNVMKALNRLKMGTLAAVFCDYLINFSIVWVLLNWLDAGVLGLAYGVSAGFMIKFILFICILKKSNLEKLHKEVVELIR